VTSRNLGTLTSWNPLNHSRPVMGLLYLYLIVQCRYTNIQILLVSVDCNAYVSLNCCVLMIFFFIIYHVLLILCTFLIYCFDLIAYCKSALAMMNSTFNPTCADDGYGNVHTYVSMCVTSFKLLYYIFLFSAECPLLLCIGVARGEHICIHTHTHIYTLLIQHSSIDG
jgi:hypothetical protein